ncbi:MAG: glutamine--fructose-6-phosphate transaminase (isomerizing) [Clostridia bacterium]|nr:glutamine--fructose-6-phosphate transaminase (isomerizing) [Clostridia bacterium]
MCGIVGYAGGKDAAGILLEGLSKLEYRGYDSAGLAVRDGSGPVSVCKTKGRLSRLYEKTEGGKTMPGHIGIGHTRWATHGEPSEDNAHPHVSDDGLVTGVHNGIIENYLELKDKLIRKGYCFYSATDTEVAVKMVDYYYKKYGLGPIDAIAKTMVRMRGSYAMGLMFSDYPDEIWAVRKDSPLIIGVKDGETFIASDVPAILKYTKKVYYIGNLEFARIRPGEVTFYDLNGEEIKIEPTEITWSADAAEKDGYEHFMMKEIHEQPRAVKDTLHSLIAKDSDRSFIDLSKTGLTDETIRSLEGITICACGSAWHVGMSAQYVIEDLARIPVRVELASEFRYRKPILGKGQLVIVISQSGETADSLAALRLAKESGTETLGVVNVVGSAIAREADHVLYTLAGPEIAVATTKAYSTQLAALYALAVKAGHVRGVISEEQYQYYLDELQKLPDAIQTALSRKEDIQRFAAEHVATKDVFFIGRNIDYTSALEGSLKMKEISYVHSEAYAAGELKHGTISLVEDGTPVIGILTQPDLYEKTLSNMVECKARGGYLVAVTTEDRQDILNTADFVLFIPKTDPHFTASVTVVPQQLLGYYMSCSRGLDVDKPRNLAKSVTVE